MHELVIVPTTVFLQAAFDTHLAVHVVLFVTILLAGALIAGKLARYLFSLPEVAGQIIGGMLLGPSGLDIAHQFDSAMIFGAVSTFPSTQLFQCSSSDFSSYFILMLSSVFAVPTLLWMAGHETDVDVIARVGFSAVVAGFLGAAMPIILIGGGLYAWVGSSWSLVQIFGMGLVFAATSVSVAVAVFFSYNRMHTRAAQVTLGAAVADDVIAVIFLSLYMIFSQQGQATLSLSSLLLHIVCTLLLMIVVGAYIIRPFVRYVSDNKCDDALPSIALICMGLFFVCAETVGHLAGVTGAYFAGLFHRMGDVGHVAEKRITPFVQALFLPLFLGSIGLQVNMHLLSSKDWALLFFVLFLAIASKLFACFVTLHLDNLINKKAAEWTGLEMWVFGSSMVARGEVGLIVSTILYGAHIFTQQQYVIAVMVVTLTTIISPILLVPSLKKLPHDIHED